MHIMCKWYLFFKNYKDRQHLLKFWESPFIVPTECSSVPDTFQMIMMWSLLAILKFSMWTSYTRNQKVILLNSKTFTKICNTWSKIWGMETPPPSKHKQGRFKSTLGITFHLLMHHRWREREGEYKKDERHTPTVQVSDWLIYKRNRNWNNIVFQYLFLISI